MTTGELIETPQRGLRADARRNNDALLRAARSVFAELGPDAPLEEIARRAGVGIGTLYRHFPTRFDLQQAVMEQHVGRLIALAEAALDESDPGAAVEQWLATKLRTSREYHGLGAAVWLVIADKPSEYGSHCELLYRRFAELLRRAQDAGVIRSDVTSRQVLRLVNGIVLSTEKAHDREREMLQLFQVVMAGLRVPPTAP